MSVNVQIWLHIKQNKAVTDGPKNLFVMIEHEKKLPVACKDICISCYTKKRVFRTSRKSSSGYGGGR